MDRNWAQRLRLSGSAGEPAVVMVEMLQWEEEVGRGVVRRHDEDGNPLGILRLRGPSLGLDCRYFLGSS